MNTAFATISSLAKCLFELIWKSVGLLKWSDGRNGKWLIPSEYSETCRRRRKRGSSAGDRTLAEMKSKRSGRPGKLCCWTRFTRSPKNKARDSRNRRNVHPRDISRNYLISLRWFFGLNSSIKYDSFGEWSYSFCP